MVYGSCGKRFRRGVAKTNRKFWLRIFYYFSHKIPKTSFIFFFSKCCLWHTRKISFVCICQMQTLFSIDFIRSLTLFRYLQCDNKNNLTLANKKVLDYSKYISTIHYNSLCIVFFFDLWIVYFRHNWTKQSPKKKK